MQSEKFEALKSGTKVLVLGTVTTFADIGNMVEIDGPAPDCVYAWLDAPEPEPVFMGGDVVGPKSDATRQGTILALLGTDYAWVNLNNASRPSTHRLSDLEHRA